MFGESDAQMLGGEGGRLTGWVRQSFEAVAGTGDDHVSLQASSILLRENISCFFVPEWRDIYLIQKFVV